MHKKPSNKKQAIIPVLYRFAGGLRLTKGTKRQGLIVGADPADSYKTWEE